MGKYKMSTSKQDPAVFQILLFSIFKYIYIYIFNMSFFFGGVLGGGRSSILPCEGKIGKPNKDSRLDFCGEQLRSTSKYAPNMLLRTWAASGLLSLPQLVWLGILSFPSVATAESELYPAAFCRVMVGSLKIRPSFRGI